MTTTDTPTRSEAERIAASLTPSVRSLVAGPMYSAISHGISAAWFHDVGYWAGRQLPKLGLAERRVVETGWVASTPTELGLAVRTLLQETK